MTNIIYRLFVSVCVFRQEILHRRFQAVREREHPPCHRLQQYEDEEIRAERQTSVPGQLHRHCHRLQVRH